MAKPGRPKTTFQLSTGNDPSLWKYDSLQEALRANIDILASLVDPELLFRDIEAVPVTNPEQPVKKAKFRRR